MTITPDEERRNQLADVLGVRRGLSWTTLLGVVDQVNKSAAAHHERAKAAEAASKDSVRRAVSAEEAVQRVQEYTEQLDQFAALALKVPDRQLYGTLARSIRKALDGEGAVEAPAVPAGPGLAVTSHTYEGDGGPCVAGLFGQPCGAARDDHDLLHVRPSPAGPADEDAAAGTFGRAFVLERDTDHTGVSGTGTVADGVEFPDGTVVVRWRGPMASTVVWARIEDAVAVHGHGGATRVVWGTPEDTKAIVERAVTAEQRFEDLRAEVRRQQKVWDRRDREKATDLSRVVAVCDAIEAEVHGQHDEDDDGMREAVRRIRAALAAAATEGVQG